MKNKCWQWSRTAARADERLDAMRMVGVEQLPKLSKNTFAGDKLGKAFSKGITVSNFFAGYSIFPHMRSAQSRHCIEKLAARSCLWGT